MQHKAETESKKPKNRPVKRKVCAKCHPEKLGIEIPVPEWESYEIINELAFVTARGFNELLAMCKNKLYFLYKHGYDVFAECEKQKLDPSFDEDEMSTHGPSIEAKLNEWVAATERMRV